MSDKSFTVAQAVAHLRAGELVAIPTETVYGLAARADSAEAVAKIYRTKGRPDFNPLIVHVASLAMAHRIAVFDDRAEALASRFWPGPLTLVLPLRDTAAIAPAVTAGLATVALRQPAHPVAAEVLEELGIPLAAPSANRSYRLSPTRPEHVRSSFGNGSPPVLDGGECAAGLESTIVALRPGGGWAVLRPGPVSEEALAAHLGPPEKSRGATIEAPGQLDRHYSPGKPLGLDCIARPPGAYMIGFGEMAGDVSLSPSGDLAEAAARLYACLHLGAASDCATISVAPIPRHGMGRAINDRLSRAAKS
ncbi:threonylcarbamoyl-AMP synthase [Erythrobacter arachoides]|uniref:Threonylcarbamoyl-AMP synthase n=1 Tax=Aurantiacibacter arachoides TaxID=1850444 RepID=A0A845A6V5_9SPHN|nr:L-threonylcarbamoyladenylate synthase [Aurantiacibacter arachoides]MXO94657.1 threonylcarbamoyl-AMP synthase [Aurantiacibacter arachoides]GGD61777.1 threonylcarbamoyl-AMP synthase [Aurantiacibacter arachoides]